MCYMESKMQEQYEHGEALADALFAEMLDFGEWIKCAIPDFDESLLDDTVNHFHFKDETVELMWLGWKAKAGL